MKRLLLRPRLRRGFGGQEGFGRQVLLIVVLLLIPATALSRGHCAKDMESAVSQLGQKYKEALIAQGINVAGALVQVWSTKDGKTWTVTIAIPGGPVCVLAQGTDWQVVPWMLTGAGT